LGPAISKRIIEMHGGKIWVESHLGCDSTLAFTLPVVVEQQVNPESKWPACPLVAHSGHPNSVLVAVWLLFTAMLFVVEPLVLHRWLLAQSKLNPEATFKAVEWLHRILLFISLVTVLGAVMGSHGPLLFE
jgi:hypothetical protein